jgi:hypothetical protein
MPFNLADFPEAFERPIWLTPYSAWREHLPVVPILLKLLRPRTFVELGTLAGDSYIGFCTAVKRLGLETQCTAVDTWLGDAHSGQYGPDILQKLQGVHEPNFAGFSRLLQATFDQAAPTFADGSIDLLHIDGMHTYEAVRHDYETWLPKMSSRGVVMFHDTTERGGDFGVWKLWEELATTRPSVNLPHCSGLGILAVGPEQPPAFLEFLWELNQRPALVKILEMLGMHMNVLLNANMTMKSLAQCRIYLYEWRKRSGQAVNEPAPSPPKTMEETYEFCGSVARGVGQLAGDALNLAAEINHLRSGKT